MKYEVIDRMYMDGVCSWCGSVHIVLRTARHIPGEYGDGHVDQWCPEHARKISERGDLLQPDLPGMRREQEDKMTATEKALLKALLKMSQFSTNRDCEISGQAWIRDDGILILDFTVSDDPQPDNDVFGEPDHIYLRLEIDRIEAHPFGPEIIFKNLETEQAVTQKHKYRCLNVRLDGAPEIYITR